MLLVKQQLPAMYVSSILHNRSRLPSASPSESSRNDNTISNSGRQDSYVNGLLQQIKLLELEISYLKQHPPAKDATRNRKESGSER